MIEAGRRGSFALKTRQCFARVAVVIEDAFQRYDSPRWGVSGAINDSHPTPANFF